MTRNNVSTGGNHDHDVPAVEATVGSIIILLNCKVFVDSIAVSVFVVILVDFDKH